MMLKPHVTRARERRVGDGRTARKSLRVKHRAATVAPVPRTPAFVVTCTGMDLPQHDHVSSTTHPDSRIGLDHGSSNVLSSHILAHYLELWSGSSTMRTKVASNKLPLAPHELPHNHENRCGFSNETSRDGKQASDII